MRTWLNHLGWLWGRKHFPGFLGTAFLSGLALSFVMPFLSMWGTRAVGFSQFQFGLLMTGSALSGISLALLFGRWSDTRIARRTVLLIGSGFGSLGYAGFSLVQGQWPLLAIAVTLVAAASICFSQFFATARSWFDGEPDATSQLPVTMSVVRVCFSVSGTLGPPIAAVVVSSYGYSGLFATVAGIHALVFAGVLWFVPKRLRPGGVANETSIARTFRRPEVLAHFVALTLIASAFTISVMNLPLAITGHLGGTTHQVGLAFGISPLAEIPLTLWFGYLASRGHEGRLLRIGGLVSALYFCLLFVSDAIWQIYFIQILNGASFAILTNVAIVAVQNLMPGQPGLATAIFGNSGSIGKLLGYFTYGLLADRVGPRGLFGVCAGIATVGALIFLLRPLGRSNGHRSSGPTLSNSKA